MHAIALLHLTTAAITYAYVSNNSWTLPRSCMLNSHSSIQSTAMLRPTAPHSAGCTFDSVGGENQVFFALNASLVINGSTVSNTLQRDTFIEYRADADAFIFTGIVAVWGPSASATVLVCSPPSNPPCACLLFVRSISASSGRQNCLYMKASHSSVLRE